MFWRLVLSREVVYFCCYFRLFLIDLWLLFSVPCNLYLYVAVYGYFHVICICHFIGHF